MVYGMVQQHNGFMRLNSRQKHGTTVEIYIPLSKESPETSAKMSSVSDSKNTETILVAEDDTAVMKLIKRILERSGFHVITASDGEKAIEYGTQNIEKIDLVLLDVMMPEKSGLEVAQELSKLKPDLRILYSSGYNEFSQHTELAIPNDAEMIQKPYHREALIQKIRSILDNS